MGNLLNDLSRLRDGHTRRISSYDRTGGNADNIRLAPGESVTLAEITGAGAVRHIWCTINHKDPMYRRNLILRMYWDGNESASVECPIGDFFGQGWGEQYNYCSLPLAASPKGGRALNCYFPMPFVRGARLTLENDSEHTCRAFYYYIDYELWDSAREDLGRFHAFWNRSCEAPPEGSENEWRQFYDFKRNLTDRYNHTIIDAKGHGHYVGVNYYVQSPTPLWYGEGDDMFFIDGEEWPPSLHGTGTEDYFNCSWCPKEAYLHPYFGYARVNDGTGFLGRTHCYRFHIQDPVIFHESLRGSIERGHNNVMCSDLVTVAYWYQALPQKAFPPLPDRDGRKNMPLIGPAAIHRWREAWRQLQGGGKTWGHEPLPEKFTEERKSQADRNEKKTAPPENRPKAQEEHRKQQDMLDRRKP